MQSFHLIVIGGGAAGIFAAIAFRKANPDFSVLVLEKSTQLLTKVKISGGGRCNVTHACFDPKQLIAHYPRGNKALLGPFTRFQPSDTIRWFAERGVLLKTESDGRMFPITDHSQTIIDCLLQEAVQTGVEIRRVQSVQHVEKQDDFFRVVLREGEVSCKDLLIATGSSSQGHAFAASLGHKIVTPVPSLFTFNLPGCCLGELSGVSVPLVEISLAETSFSQKGPLLITHWGFSGPAVLKLSAWAARWLHEQNYEADVLVDWVPEYLSADLTEQLRHARSAQSLQSLGNAPCFMLPKSLWKALLIKSAVDPGKKIGTVSNAEFQRLQERLKKDVYRMKGKTTHKEEFVTCGGVALDEVNFKTMQSKICPGLYFAGEVLDIDGVTGGFNFQNAWTTGWIAGQRAP